MHGVLVMSAVHKCPPVCVCAHLVMVQRRAYQGEGR